MSIQDWKKIRNRRCWTFPISNVEDLGDESLSQFIPICDEEININEIESNQLCRNNLLMRDNNKSKRFVTHSSCIDISNSLYKNMKNDDQI